MSKDFAPEEIKRPTRVVDVLIRYEYAGYHPEKEQKSDHLLLQRNRFARCLVALMHELKRQALSRVKVEDFYKIDNLGVECTPPCWSCRCGKCHLGTKDYNLKEEMELHLIEKNLKFDSLVWLHHSLRKCYFCLSRFFCLHSTDQQPTFNTIHVPVSSRKRWSKCW